MKKLALKLALLSMVGMVSLVAKPAVVSAQDVCPGVSISYDGCYDHSSFMGPVDPYQESMCVWQVETAAIAACSANADAW